jgi:hypothetical protein
MFGQAYKKIILVLVLFNLSACSIVGGLWYDRIDKFIANEFLEYAYFSKAQENYIREATREFKYWNIQNELPEYKKLLLQFRLLDSTTHVDDIDDIHQKVLVLGYRSRDFFMPYLGEFYKTITNKQIEEIAIHFDRLMEERKLKLDNQRNNFQAALKKDFVRYFRLVGVRLNNEQINTIRLLSSDLEDTRYQLINDQIKWNQQFITILTLRQKKNFEESLINHINSLSSEDPNMRAVINQITAEIIASLDKKQRARFQKKLVVFETSIDQILAKHNQSGLPK